MVAKGNSITFHNPSGSAGVGFVEYTTGKSERKLVDFRCRGGWIQISELRVYETVQLALNHHLYGPSLRVYYYLGTAVEIATDDKWFVFITSKSSNGGGPPAEKGRNWAIKSLAIYIEPGDWVHYVDVSQIALLKPGHDGRVFGRYWDTTATEEFKGKLGDQVQHLVDCHINLYDILSRHFEDSSGWKILRMRAAAMLGLIADEEQAVGDEEQCKRKACQLLPELAKALAGCLESEDTSRPWGRKASIMPRAMEDKAKPSKDLCTFLSGRVESFIPRKHRLLEVGTYPLDCEESISSGDIIEKYTYYTLGSE